MNDEPDLIIRQEGRAGRITLNRPKALNALTYNQSLEIERTIDRWADDAIVQLVIIDGAGERAMCAGGDVQALYEQREDGGVSAAQFWRDEYRLNSKIGRYPKPFVAIMDGIVMGGGIGLSGHASHRIVTERSMLAMPETTIGLIPDVGGTWLLANAPGRLGEYLGMLGERMGAADAIYAGFADTFVSTEQLDKLVETLCDPSGDPVGLAAASFVSAPPPTVHADRQTDIDTIFAADSLEGIIENLQTSDADWSQGALKAIDQRSPLSLKLTLAAVREARTYKSLEDSLKLEFRLCSRLARHGEFFEGIRALLIDKDKAPKWNPSSVAGVSDAMVSEFMGPLEHLPELTFDTQ